MAAGKLKMLAPTPAASSANLSGFVVLNTGEIVPVVPNESGRGDATRSSLCAKLRGLSPAARAQLLTFRQSERAKAVSEADLSLIAAQCGFRGARPR
jgi:hypothetical protein